MASASKAFTTDDGKNSKNLRFSKLPILKFYGLFLGLIGFIDAKGIVVAQPTWP